MPFRPPAALLYLTSLFRPSLLRPDIRVPTIAQLDTVGLRRRGFNAVVIDKDNCLTWPEEDRIWPDLSASWTALVRAFPPGRVLIVSNSAGLARKDPSSIAAEATSIALKAPVLLHTRPKPACAEDIVDYFRGALGGPQSLRGSIREQGRRVQEEVEREEAESAVWRRVVESVEKAPLLGPSEERAGQGGRDGKKDGSRIERGKMLQASVEPEKSSAGPSRTREADQPGDGKGKARQEDDMRILVIGDRQFTDMLLATRLNRLLPALTTDEQRVVSVQTTLLPKPDDVRLLRWIEAKLSRGRLREGSVDWGRYTISSSDGTSAPIVRRRNWRDFVPLYRTIESAPRLSWDRSTWRPLPMAVGLGRGIGWTLGGLGRTGGRGMRWVWTKTKAGIAESRARRIAAASEAKAAEGASAVALGDTAGPAPVSVGTASAVTAGAA